LSRLVRVPGEMAKTGRAIGHAVAMQHGHHEVAHSRHRLWRPSSPNTTRVFAQGDVAHIVQLVLNRPMRSTQAEQVRGAGPLWGQAGDLVVHFGVPASPALRLMHQPTHLGQAGPVDRGRVRVGSGMERPKVDPPMPIINGSRPLGGLDRRERSAARPAGARAGCF